MWTYRRSNKMIIDFRASVYAKTNTNIRSYSVGFVTYCVCTNKIKHNILSNKRIFKKLIHEHKRYAASTERKCKIISRKFNPRWSASLGRKPKSLFHLAEMLLLMISVHFAGISVGLLENANISTLQFCHAKRCLPVCVTRCKWCTGHGSLLDPVEKKIK